MHKNLFFKLLYISILLAFSTPALSEYFFDQGLHSAVVRTEYNSTNEGTSNNPITLSPGNVLYPCQAGQDPIVITSCIETTFPYSNDHYAPTTFSNAYPWSFNGGDTASNFWVLTMNNESWQKHDPVSGVAINPGAPNWSLPRTEPGAGIMGFKPIVWTEGGENFYRIHLVLNQTFINPVEGGIPFLSIGADSNRGNGGVLGYMNDEYSPSKLTWNSKVWDVLENNQANYWANIHWVFTTATWGGKTRMLFVALYRESYLNGAELNHSDATTGTHRHWNWQIQESLWYPGADIAYMDAEDVYNLCGFSMTRLRNVGDSASYSVILDDLYRCASNKGLFDTPMPYTPVPITGAFWANESVGQDIALWTSVHGMRMKLPPNPCPLCRTANQSNTAESTYPPVAAHENETPNEVSLIAQRFRNSCKDSSECWQENERYLDGMHRVRRDNPNKVMGTIQDFFADLKQSN